MHEYLKIDENGQLERWHLTIHDVREANRNVLFIEDGVDHSHLGYPLARPAPELEVRRWQAIRSLPPIEIDGNWLAQAEVYDQPLSIEDKRIELKRDADLIARQKRDRVTAAISPAEMASWPIKRAEALAYSASTQPADAPNLALEAQARGVPLAALTTKVLAKASQLAALEAAIAGRCGAIQDAAEAAQIDAELLAIDFDAGWPV